MNPSITNKIHSIFKYDFSCLSVFNAVLALSLLLTASPAAAVDSYISEKSRKNYLPLVAEGKSSPLCRD